MNKKYKIEAIGNGKIYTTYSDDIVNVGDTINIIDDYMECIKSIVILIEEIN